MVITIANRSLACSTLMVGGFGFSPYNFNNFDHFKMLLIDAIKKANKNDLSVFGSEQLELQGYCVRDFAFITASTSQSQRNVEEYLSKLGFVGTKPVTKMKNSDNICRFWVQTIPEFLKALDASGEEGYPKKLKKEFTEVYGD